MRIINARTGKLQTIPFSLGQKGPGRWLEEIKVSNRPGQQPTSSDDVSYFTFGEERKHVILTNGDNKRGILLRIDTSGVYTKGSSGAITLKGGKATMLTQGTWAEGGAGLVASGPDQLWHVEGPALFVVILQGGERKGMGHRYLIVTKSLGTVMIKRDELAQLIATDDNPEVAEVARMFQSEVHEDVQQALLLADKLEEHIDEPQYDVTHFVTECQIIEDVVKGYGLAIPAAMGDKVKGVSDVQARTIVPGFKSLVALDIGPAGGKRYGFEEVMEVGLTRVQEVCDRPYTRKSVLAIAQDSNWVLAWKDYKDGEVTSYVVANSGGIHYKNGGAPIRTQAWAGVPPVTPTESDFVKIFEVMNEPKSKPKPEPHIPADGWTMDDLKLKFGG